MADASAASLQDQVKQQGDVVRKLKEQKAPTDEVILNAEDSEA